MMTWYNSNPTQRFQQRNRLDTDKTYDFLLRTRVSTAVRERFIYVITMCSAAGPYFLNNMANEMKNHGLNVARCTQNNIDNWRGEINMILFFRKTVFKTTTVHYFGIHPKSAIYMTAANALTVNGQA